MAKISGDEIRKWRIEIDNAEEFREKHFGKMFSQKIGAGENIDYFELGTSDRFINDRLDGEITTTLNIVYPIVKNVIPTLYFKNPNVTAIPKRSEDEDSAVFVSSILNYYMKELDLKGINRQIIFDAYVLGMGVSKIGYTTKFGTMPTEENIKKEQKEKEKEKQKGLLEKLGLKKPKEEEKDNNNPELDEFIRSESPFVYSVNPFNFGIDPAATSINNARFVFEKITKILSEVKKNKNYSNTSDLKGTLVDGADEKKIPETQIDDFKTVDIYEVYYKTDEGISILVLAKEGKREVALRHQKSAYRMEGFPYEVLTFNKHNHGLYPISDVSLIKGLQDRTNQTMDNILDQVDKYIPKIFVDETAVTEGGKKALRDGDIGAIVYTNKDPNSVTKESNFTQIKGDLVALIDKLMEVIMLETGLTRAQLQGLTSAQTATEAQIGQAGQNLRVSDKLDQVTDFAQKQLRKLWQVIQQFVDLEEIQLITGDEGTDEQTGRSKFSWLPDIDGALADKMAKGEYRFEIEIGSTEKPDLPILRKQLEGLANILMGEGVLMAFQTQGFKINIAEIFKRYLQTFPDVFTNVGKIIQPIGPSTTGLLQPQVPPGSARGPSSQQPGTPPNMADIISANEGSKGQLDIA